ncbi:MAG: hypothetical protein QOI31_1709 [Solirubrobacterales bacterium]|jgi:preprotein translocase subunit SecG|nr:hypothetical protein [Solirubrobacterales bacterium]
MRRVTIILSTVLTIVALGLCYNASLSGTGKAGEAEHTAEQGEPVADADK